MSYSNAPCNLSWMSYDDYICMHGTAKKSRFCGLNRKILHSPDDSFTGVVMSPHPENKEESNSNNNITSVGLALSELLKLVKDFKSKAEKFKSLTERLEQVLELLTRLVDDIEKLDRELDQKEDVLVEANKLLAKGEKLLAKGEKLLAKGEKLLAKCSTNCFCNYWGRRALSKKLIEFDHEIVRFGSLYLNVLGFRETISNGETLNAINRKVSSIHSTVGCGPSNSNGWSAGCCDSLLQSGFKVALDRPLKELKEMLLNSQEVIHVLTAAGGCGKTTLAKALYHDPEVRGKYGVNIFFVTVSGKTLEDIVQKLYEHKGYPVPNFQFDQDAVNHLEELLIKLRPDPVMFILDDVSADSKFPLSSFVFDIPDYKVLVTSRSTFSVASSSTYKLQLLNDEDAMALFRHSAFRENDGPDFIDDELVNEIVRKCKNNPLVLKVTGASLKGEAAAVWKCRLREWSDYILNSNNPELDSLRTSLDALDNKGILKECFLDLASFPEDLKIPATALIDMWVELYNLQEEEDAVVNLHELSTRNLIDMLTTRKDAREVYSCYNDHFVTQHDNLRELAVHPTNPVERRKRLILEITKNCFPELSSDLKQQAAEARLLSISTDEKFISNLSDIWNVMELRNVEALVLNLRTKGYNLPEFLKRMGEVLKVLIITNHGLTPTELNDFTILGSLSNIRRIRFEHVIIPSISEPITPLRNLKKLSLVMCKMHEAFKSDASHFSKIFPELKELDIDYCNDLVEFPPQLCDFSCLKKLSITNCPKLVKVSETIGKLETLEVLNLHACSDLTELPNSIGSLKNLNFLNISDCVSLDKLPDEICQLGSLEKIHMRGCSSLVKLPSSVIDMSQLKAVYCDEERAALWEPYQPFLTMEIHEVKENINLNWLR